MGGRGGLRSLDSGHYFWPQMVWGGASRVHLELPLMIDAAFCAAGALIWLGGVLGKASPTQLLWLTVPYVPLYAVNHQLVFKNLGVSCSSRACSALWPAHAARQISASSGPGSVKEWAHSSCKPHALHACSPRSHKASMAAFCSRALQDLLVQVYCCVPCSCPCAGPGRGRQHLPPRLCCLLRPGSFAGDLAQAARRRQQQPAVQGLVRERHRGLGGGAAHLVSPVLRNTGGKGVLGVCAKAASKGSVTRRQQFNK